MLKSQHIYFVCFKKWSLRGGDVPAGTEHSLMAHWLLGCIKASWQSWQGEAAVMHGPSPHQWIVLCWNGWQRQTNLNLFFHSVFWVGRNLTLVTSLLPCWGNLSQQPSQAFPLWCCFGGVVAGCAVGASWFFPNSKPPGHSCQLLQPQAHLKKLDLKQRVNQTSHVHDSLCILCVSVVLFTSLVRYGSLSSYTRTPQVMWSRTGSMAVAVSLKSLRQVHLAQFLHNTYPWASNAMFLFL